MNACAIASRQGSILVRTFWGVAKRMSRLFQKSLGCVAIVAALGGGGWDRALAQQAGESVKIKPYTGPPIYLDEPEQVAAPTIVTREKIEDKYEDSGKLR